MFYYDNLIYFYAKISFQNWKTKYKLKKILKHLADLQSKPNIFSNILLNL
jgi:hypothetical protein